MFILQSYYLIIIQSYKYGHNRSYFKRAPLCATLPDGPRNYDAPLDSSKGIEEILMLAWV